MVYKASNETYDFRKFKTIHVFGNEVRLLRYINKLKSKTKPHNSESKKIKRRCIK